MDPLDEALRALGHERRAELTPPPLAAETIAALPAPRASRIATFATLGLAAAACAACVWLALPRAEPAPPIAIVAPIAPRTAAPAPALAASAPPRPPASRPASPVPPKPVEWRTPFVEIPGADAWPAPQAATVIRVELPSEALSGYGLAAAGPRVPARLRADLVIGDDGLARAIRLVQ